MSEMSTRTCVLNEGGVARYLDPEAGSAKFAHIANYREAYGASWDTQAQLFQSGKPVNGDPHLRKFQFADGSYVVIQAYRPGVQSTPVNGGSASWNYAAWQGYRMDYFSSSTATQPWGTQYMYGWLPASGRESVNIYGSYDPNQFPDFAWAMPEGVEWWKWRSGRAEPRACTPIGQAWQSSVHSLVDQMASLTAADTGAGGVTSTGAHLQASSQDLAVVH